MKDIAERIELLEGFLEQKFKDDAACFTKKPRRNLELGRWIEND